MTTTWGSQTIQPPTLPEDPTLDKLSLQGTIVFASSTVFVVVAFVCFCITSRSRQVNSTTTAGGERGGHDGGLKKEIIVSLPVFMYSSKSAGGRNLECPVCLEEFEEEEKGRILPGCQHSFHLECIDLWLNSHSTCPVCRSTVKYESSSDVIV